MINRTLVRTKVLQTLFAFYYDDEQTLLSAKKNLLNSFSDTYSLYMMMLDFVNEMVAAAEDKIAYEEERAKVRHEEYVPNLRFVNNRFAGQVFNNRRLRAYLEENHLGWDAAHGVLRVLWKQIQEAPCYIEYMQLENPTYEDDKQLWRHIMQNVMADNQQLEAALEEMEVQLDKKDWTTDINVVLSYVIKTIKQFKQEKGAEQPLLEMFDQEEELTFAKDLLKHAINHRDDYRALIESHLQNWKMERVAYMDQLIMQLALAEIINFPNIPIEISINEYLEISKDYSSEKSYQFINGVLNEIVQDLKRQNKLMKAVMLD